MISDLMPYPAMKDSGVPWLEEVPEHWVVAPGRACLTETHTPNTGLIEKTVLSLSYGQIVVKPEDKLHGLVPASFETYQIVEPGDIICRPTDLQNDKTSLRFGFSDYRGIITSAYICLRTLDCIDRRFGHLLLHAYDLKKIFYGLGSGLRQNLDWRDFKTLSCLLPPLPEQAAIVRFLDYVDRRIRRYIRAKQKLIKLLEEQKQVIIHHAVTRGLDPNVRLKPSGVEWLGDVPEHWVIVSAKQVSKIFIPQRDKPELNEEVGLPWVTPECVGARDVAISGCLVSPQAAKYAGCRPVPSGSIIASCVGRFGVASINEDPVYINQQLQAYVTTSAIDARYLRYMIRISKPYFEINGNSTTLAYVNRQGFSDLPLVLPLLSEQETIVSAIERSESHVDMVLLKTNREISLLREYRTRLISDVVTGKLDVRCVTLPVAEDVQIQDEWNGTLDAESDLTVDQELPELAQEAGD